jgi:tRNA-2-methylthio-N6-dimethylallyladenosine synthase
MPAQIDESEKDDRLARLQALLESQRLAFNSESVGREMPVLFEKPGRHAGQLIGRTPYLQAVHVEAGADLIGLIAPVTISSAAHNSLAGALILESA